jgi:hypothetical protein
MVRVLKSKSHGTELRPIIGGDKLDNDYRVVFEDRAIGRIQQANER